MPSAGDIDWVVIVQPTTEAAARAAFEAWLAAEPGRRSRIKPSDICIDIMRTTGGCKYRYRVPRDLAR